MKLIVIGVYGPNRESTYCLEQQIVYLEYALGRSHRSALLGSAWVGVVVVIVANFRTTSCLVRHVIICGNRLEASWRASSLSISEMLVILSRSHNTAFKFTSKVETIRYTGDGRISMVLLTINADKELA